MDEFVVGDEEEEGGEEGASNEGDILKEFENNFTLLLLCIGKKTYHLLEGNSSSAGRGSKKLPKSMTSYDSNEDLNEISTESDNEVLFESGNGSQEQVGK